MYSEYPQKTERAIYYYMMAIQFRPNYAEAYNNIGVLYKKLDNCLQAIEYYKLAVSINPNLFETHNNLGVIYSLTGNVFYHSMFMLFNS